MIYFIQGVSKKHVKIGYTENIEKRLKQLQVGNPTTLKVLVIMEGNSKTETALHYMFEHIRCKGEWFKFTDEIKWFINTIKSNPKLYNISEIQRISLEKRIMKKCNRLGKKSRLHSEIKKFRGV